jgi:hypothetical protein
MNNFKSAFIRAAIAVAFVLSGCASFEASVGTSDILAELHDTSQSGGE